MAGDDETKSDAVDDSDDSVDESADESSGEPSDESGDTKADEALERARALVQKEPKKPDPGRWLALVPITIAVLMMSLMMPRPTVPDAVPIPTIDERALAQTMRADDARTASAKETRLPTDVLALGSALRALQSAQLKTDSNELELQSAQAQLEEARHMLGTRKDSLDDVLALRAVQMDAFLVELTRFEQSGTVSRDLEELGGGFVRRAKTAGWIVNGRVVLDMPQRRAIFKTVWNSLAGVDALEAFALTLDEQRTLYALYIARPYPGEQQQRTIDAMRQSARSGDQCARAAADDRRAREMWRADKIRRFGQIDPMYPTAYALGVAYYRAGRYDLASDAFRVWLDAHPDGPLSTRARNHLKASLEAYGAI